MNNQMSKPSLTRAQKILLSLFDLSGGTNKPIRFEDIAVSAFKKYKSDFQLRGYPEYPDTGDIIHKPLYSELKKAGYVLSGNKYFSLTPKGVAYAKSLNSQIAGNSTAVNDNFRKLTAGQEKELERLRSSKAVELYLSGNKENILDIDFYSYLEVTVRTNKFDFLGRLATVEDAINATKDQSSKLYSQLRDCHNYLLNKFKNNIDYVQNSKGGRR